jgi:outer membrane biosynthesis protein TonB
MSIHAHSPYEEREESSTRWVITFILLSLLAHAVLITAILLITVFMPVPKIKIPEPGTTTLTLTQLPPQAAPRKPMFVPTKPQANVPHTQQQMESANDTKLTSKSQTARKPDAIMPDVTGKVHNPDLNQSPNVVAPPKPEVSTTQPTPKQAKPEKPTPPQASPDQAKQPPPKPPEPNPKPLPPTPPKPAPPQLDANGLPILPPLNAPTMAPPDSAAQPLAPAPSQPQQAIDAHGGVGMSGDNSPAAMATALGKYKQKVYEAVGSHWYPKIENYQLFGVGVVQVQFTIHSDGTVETKELDDGGGGMQLLTSASVNAIRESAPFDPFPPEMIKELISEQGGDGSSYTAVFSFSIYGN